MPKKKSILVVTIGTRDLAFQVSSHEWLNLGNDRSPDGDSISEQALETYLNEFKGAAEIPLCGTALDHLVQQTKPDYRNCLDILKFWDVAKIWYNQLFHRLLGLEKPQVFRAWETSTQNEWESAIEFLVCFLRFRFHSINFPSKWESSFEFNLMKHGKMFPFN